VAVVCNTDVRERIRNAGVYQWQVAEKLSIPETSFCRLLRKELNEEMEKRITQAIKELEAEKHCEVTA
jgi:predicted XRE-type DNA-binding protein